MAFFQNYTCQKQFLLLQAWYKCSFCPSTFRPVERKISKLTQCLSLLFAFVIHLVPYFGLFGNHKICLGCKQLDNTKFRKLYSTTVPT